MKRPPEGVPHAGAVYRFAASIAFTIFDLQRWQFHVDGEENVPRRGGAVIAANHTSFWDFFTIGLPIYRGLGRPIRILAKESLFRTPVFGNLMRRSKHIPVHRGEGAHALSSAVAALRQGELVLVLPEQTVSTSLDLLPFKNGAARMAAEAGVPLLPAVSWGSQRFHTVGRRPAPRWKLPVSVGFGEPMHLDAGDDPDVATEELQARVQALLDRAQETYVDRHLAEGAWWHPARLGGSAVTHEDALAERASLEQQWRAPRDDAADRVS